MTIFFGRGGGHLEWVLYGEIRPLFEDASAGKLSSLDEVTLFFMETNRSLFYSYPSGIEYETSTLKLMAARFLRNVGTHPVTLYLFILLYKRVSSHADYNRTVIF
jgi:hypothetical protein